MVILVNQSDLEQRRPKEQRVLGCPVYQERWEQENAVVCMNLCSEVSKLTSCIWLHINNINRSTEVQKYQQNFKEPLASSAPESFQQLSGIHEILLLPKQRFTSVYVMI